MHISSELLTEKPIRNSKKFNLKFKLKKIHNQDFYKTKRQITETTRTLKHLFIHAVKQLIPIRNHTQHRTRNALLQHCIPTRMHVTGENCMHNFATN